MLFKFRKKSKKKNLGCDITTMVSRKKKRQRGGAPTDSDKPIEASGPTEPVKIIPGLLSPGTWPTPFMIYVVLAVINILYMLSSFFTKKTAFPLKPNHELDISTPPTADKAGKTLALKTKSENGSGALIVVTGDGTKITEVNVTAVATGNGYKSGDTLTVSKEELTSDGAVGTVDGPLKIKITEDDLDKTEKITGTSIGISIVSACIFSGFMWWLCTRGHLTMAWVFLLLPVIGLIVMIVLVIGALSL
jgi:hypothetical protein